MIKFLLFLIVFDLPIVFRLFRLNDARRGPTPSLSLSALSRASSLCSRRRLLFAKSIDEAEAVHLCELFFSRQRQTHFRIDLPCHIISSDKPLVSDSDYERESNLNASRKQKLLQIFNEFLKIILKYSKMTSYSGGYSGNS